MKKRPRILLVDDEARFIDSLNDILGHYNYECVRASTGHQAIDLLKQAHFDVALLDVGLPDMSGLDIVGFINTSRCRTTVIMLTGMNTVETAVQAMKQGAYDFLNKPVNYDLLLRTLDRAVKHNRLQKELHESNIRFQTLAEAAWEGIAIHQNGRLIEANEQFFRMFGYTRKEFKTAGFLEQIMTAKDLETFDRSYFTDTDRNSFEFTGVRRDQKTFLIEAKSNIMDYFGRKAHVLIMRDISERIRAEEEKLLLQKKLATASKLNALGMMAGSVAHDLNNILTAIVSYPGFLLMQMNESDRYYKDIKKIQDAGMRAAAVVDDLVSIARGGSAKASTSNLNDIILGHLESIEHSERLLKFPDVVIQTDLQENLHLIDCSTPHVNKLLLNLIGNALEAVQRNGTVRLTTKNCRLSHRIENKYVTLSPGRYVKFTVADSGPGISPKDVDHIFNPFFTTKRTGRSGTGLGLTIVWNIVREHNGWIEVKNTFPGAAFEVYLPVTDKQPSHCVQLDRKELTTGHGEMILLVDDEWEQSLVMEQMLGVLGYKTHTVASGEEGVEFVRKQSVDLVLLDMIMGDGLNGRETYEKILRVRPEQKAIIVSGYLDNEEIRKAKTLGISVFLEKPVTLPAIGHAIKQTLRRSKAIVSHS
jgi:PAS domain S-box-containing protein